LWYYSDPERELERMYFLAPATYGAAEDAAYDLKIIVSSVENAAERSRSSSYEGQEDASKCLVQENDDYYFH
jgi:hypothetical protein